MNLLTTSQLLHKAAQYYQEEKQDFSKGEISKKLKHIKDLTKDKKISRQNIQKEIIHLENKLQGILELETVLLKQKRRESAKIASLKRQVSTLKQKLAHAEDKDLQKKIDKLSYLLGDMLARCGTTEDVALSKKVMQEMQLKLPPELNIKIQPPVEPTAPKIPQKEGKTEKIVELQQRIDQLKKELVTNQKIAEDPQRVELIGQMITLLEKKLRLLTEEKKPRHTLIFTAPLPKDIDHALEQELPLPPPPKTEIESK